MVGKMWVMPVAVTIMAMGVMVMPMTVFMAICD